MAVVSLELDLSIGWSGDSRYMALSKGSAVGEVFSLIFSFLKAAQCLRW